MMSDLSTKPIHRRVVGRVAATAMVLMVCAIVLWFTQFDSYRVQHKAAAYFRERGAEVDTSIGGAAWTRSLVGREWSADVTRISFLKKPHTITMLFDTVINPPDLSEPDNLYRYRIGIDGNVMLSKVPHLTVLELPATDINDDSIRSIGAVDTLEVLDISYTRVSDKGVRSVARLTALRVLNLEGVHVTDAGLESIRELKLLESLNISSTLVTDDAIGSLGGLVSLTCLKMTDTAITDKGIGRLGSLKQLQSLSLAGTALSDKVLEALTSSLPSLEKLEIRSTKVTFEGIDAARKKLPQLKTDLDRARRANEFFRALQDRSNEEKKK